MHVRIAYTRMLVIPPNISVAQFMGKSTLMNLRQACKFEIQVRKPNAKAVCFAEQAKHTAFAMISVR